MLQRLWLTYQQANALKRALRAHITTLSKCSEEAHIDKNFDMEEKYVEEANTLDEILNVLEG